MSNRQGLRTKDRILEVAFVLFATKPFYNVTFNNFEEVTSLSRGTILYHFKNKESIFTNMIDKYIFSAHSIHSYDNSQNSVKDFIDSFIDKIVLNKQMFNDLGIDNMNKALVNITLQGTCFYKGFNEVAVEWENKQIMEWKKVVQLGIDNNELDGSFNPMQVANYFQRVYYGISYSGIPLNNGCEIDSLREGLYMAYDHFKVKI